MGEVENKHYYISKNRLRIIYLELIVRMDEGEQSHAENAILNILIISHYSTRINEQRINRMHSKWLCDCSAERDLCN